MLYGQKSAENPSLTRKSLKFLRISTPKER